MTMGEVLQYASMAKERHIHLLPCTFITTRRVFHLPKYLAETPTPFSVKFLKCSLLKRHIPPRAFNVIFLHWHLFVMIDQEVFK
ncbi:hypothetical protein BX666DRAFT_501732 [Dichotomocladium elegans]|nr:hypothetical protein BX666DRAFT_501732 [Dichotomocladium elegans]